MCALTNPKGCRKDEFTVEIAVAKLSLYDDLLRAAEYLAQAISEASPFIDVAVNETSAVIIPFNSSAPTLGLQDALNTLALCRRLEYQIKNKKWEQPPQQVIPE